MNMEAMTERAVESATEIAAEAYSVTDAPFVHTKESWADCLADLITDPENDEDFRKDLAGAIEWLGFAMDGSKIPKCSLIDAKQITAYAISIGTRVIENAIKNGVTLENIGKVE